MSYRKVTVDEGQDLSVVMDGLDYNFTSCLDTADVMDTDILDYTVTDSR